MNTYILIDLLQYKQAKKALNGSDFKYLFEKFNNPKILEFSPVLAVYNENILNQFNEYIVISSRLEMDEVLNALFKKCFSFSNFENSMCKLYEPFTVFSLFDILNVEQKHIVFSGFESFTVLFNGEIRSHFYQSTDCLKTLIMLENAQFESIFEKRIEYFKINFCKKNNADFYQISAIVDYALQCEILEIPYIERFVIAAQKIKFDVNKFNRECPFLKDPDEPDLMKILQLESYMVAADV